MLKCYAPSKRVKNNEINVVNVINSQYNKSEQNTSDNESKRVKLNNFNNAFKIPLINITNINYGNNKTLGVRNGVSKISVHDPNAENALILYSPPEIGEHEKLSINKFQKLVHVVVDPVLTKFLRPHQRDGVKFMYDCLTGSKIEGCYGCIMADDMGLGKTLQCITIMYTLLRQSPRGPPEISKAMVVSPASLVKNWEKEVIKWLGNRILIISIEGGGKDIISNQIEKYRYYPPNMPIVLIISYETFRGYVDNFASINLGLVICDEGHRLKNQDNQIYQALCNLVVQKRILISGTPIQNDLLEYFSLVHFVNQGILGSRGEFRKSYEIPIIKGRDSLASDKEKELGDIKLKELLQIVNKCIIRRTAEILSHYLPIKTEHVICIRLTNIQFDIYNELTKSKILYSDQTSSLALITLFKKICNHPYLINDVDTHVFDSFPSIKSIITKFKQNALFKPEDSGKFLFLDYLLTCIKSKTNDKIVLVSNYTQTIDLFENLCKLKGFLYLRLDGTLSIKKRQKIVDRFNDPSTPEFIFMLSSKAGGCGLNLIGANRLIMFDPDWNPANDSQAMARIWRDGQIKPVFIYRLVTTGTIEEKILQRQAHKKALSSCVVDEIEQVERYFSEKDLRELFLFNSDTVSSTHDQLKCKRCLLSNQIHLPPDDANCNKDLSLWMHAWNSKSIQDQFLKTEAWAYSNISFIFHQISHKKQLITC